MKTTRREKKVLRMRSAAAAGLAVLALICWALPLAAQWDADSGTALAGERVSFTTFFEPNVPTPFELLYYEETGSSGDDGSYYLSKLIMQNEHDGMVLLEDVGTSEVVRRYSVDVENGIGAPLDPTPNPGLDDFFYDNYSRWCGKVHNGKNGKWQFCTGKDCPGGWGLCIKACVNVVNGVCVP